MPGSGYIRQRPRHRNPVAGFLHNTFLAEKLNNWLGYLIVIGIAGGFGYLTSKEMLFGAGLLGFVIGLAIIIACVVSPEVGLHINLIYAFFSYLLARWSQDQFPVGVVWDIMVVANFLGLFINNPDLKKNTAKFFKSGPILFFFIIFLYLVVQIANPEGTSPEGWFQIIRKILATLIILFIAYNVLDSLLAALYGMYQQYFGLFQFEEWWIRSVEERFRLIFVHGSYRKFSTMSDPTCLGVMMASCALLFMIIGINGKRSFNKFVLIAGAVCMMMAMSFSGTRTAYLMLIGGICIFILLTFNRKSTRIFSVFAVLAFLFLMFAPIYSSPTLIRFRTSFSGTKDESYKVREVNRATIRPYLYSHPIGGGIATTGSNGIKYNPGHPLAGFPPDSAYLNKALETGWIGLIMSLTLYFLTLKCAIQGYFRAKSNRIKIIFAAIAAFFFSFYVGEMAQEAVGQFTNMAVYYPIMALMVRLRELTKVEERQEEEEVPTYE
jgi:putative inorganic carbon (hco3(-)) transporter